MQQFMLVRKAIACLTIYISKASPHNLNGNAVIIGDAAHAMVPFYGQGMNCGFQDVQVLHEILDKHGINPNSSRDKVTEALDEYSRVRVKDAHAICDLAMYNHYEMQSAVTSMRFLARKKLEGLVHLCFPRLIIPLYTMVSFSTLPYSKAIERWHRQTFWLNVVMGSVTVVATGAVVAATAVGLRRSRMNCKDLVDFVKSIRM